MQKAAISAWTIVGTISTAVAAGAAAVQILISRRDANRRAAIDLLARIDDKLIAIFPENINELQDAILASYKGDVTPLSVAACKYLALLNSIDLLAYSVKHKLTDKNIAMKHVRTLLQTSVLSASFLKELRECCKDEEVYEDLYRVFIEEQEKSRAALQKGG